MNQNCDVILLGEPVGSAKITREGLYYRFECHCRFPDREIYRLQARCGDRVTELGVCVPMDNDFGLLTRIPVSRLGQGDITVAVKGQEAAAKEAPVKDNVFPVEADKPFDHLEQLDTAVLQGEGIAITAPAPAPQDSDPSQEPPQIWEQP